MYTYRYCLFGKGLYNETTLATLVLYHSTHTDRCTISIHRYGVVIFGIWVFRVRNCVYSSIFMFPTMMYIMTHVAWSSALIWADIVWHIHKCTPLRISFAQGGTGWHTQYSWRYSLIAHLGHPLVKVQRERTWSSSSRPPSKAGGLSDRFVNRSVRSPLLFNRSGGSLDMRSVMFMIS